MSRTEIRPAVGADVPWLLEECRAFDRFANQAQQAFSFVPDDAAMATAVLSQIVASCVCYVAVRVADGEELVETPLGFIVGALHPHPFNPTVTVLTELLWWVRLEARGSTVGGRLLGVFEAYGHQHADAICMTLEADSPVMPSSLRKRGYVPRETSYVLPTNRHAVAA